MNPFSEADVELLKELADKVDGARDRLNRAHTVEGVARALVLDCKTLIAVTHDPADLVAAGELMLVAAETFAGAQAIRIDASGTLDVLVDRLESETARVERGAGGGS